MRELTESEEKVINLGIIYREMTETEGWQAFRSDIEHEIEMSQEELEETIVIEDSFGKPKSVLLGATITAYKRLLKVVDNVIENHQKLSKVLMEE